MLHDVSVVDISEAVFAEYSGLVPARRSHLTDGSEGAERSVITKHRETDLALVQCLIAEKGVCYWLEHADGPASSSRGMHSLVLAGHQHTAAQLGPVRFHRGNASERPDSLEQWLAS